MKILFVCLGNICRSPAAEAVMNKLLREKGMDGKVICDSAGTSGAHKGALADPRMRKKASQREVEIESVSRQVELSDFESFDLIVAMDRQNLADLRSLSNENPLSRAKIILMTRYSPRYHGQDIPDPYYGGEKGFDVVLDMLEKSTQGLFANLS